MRIEGTYRPTLTARAGYRSGAGTFMPEGGPATREAAAALDVSESPTIDSLLALQAVEDPLLKKKKALRRGGQLLDTLDAIKSDLLVGGLSEDRLDMLAGLLGQVRERGDPRLDALLDDIDLRVRVELAKFGRFPG